MARFKKLDIPRRSLRTRRSVVSSANSSLIAPPSPLGARPKKKTLVTNCVARRFSREVIDSQAPFSNFGADSCSLYLALPISLSFYLRSDIGVTSAAEEE